MGALRYRAQISRRTFIYVQKLAPSLVNPANSFLIRPRSFTRSRGYGGTKTLFHRVRKRMYPFSLFFIGTQRVENDENWVENY
ncbi:hypothetical protein TNCV_2719501 [Trichonephila clavipes]|nr:hypothetical protein TNCV_2719501 [Trichonephila clavipes]